MIQTLENIPKHLTKAQKEAFFDVFWSTWAANGFGTLTKKDTELLIFGCLNKAFGKEGPQNNYEWATLLRLTPTKVKSMRLEAHLRFGHLFGNDPGQETADFLRHFTELQAIDVRGLTASGGVDDVRVSFVVEDPVIQMEIEQRLKDNGTYLDFHRNREVVKLRLVDFFRIVASDDQKEAIDRWVRDKATEAAEGKGLKLRVTAHEYANKSELNKLKTFVDDLANYSGVKPLTDHLKTIVISQSER